MRTKSNFWLVMHNLTSELEKEGKTEAEQVASLTEVLEAAPQPVITAYLENLEVTAKIVHALLATAKTK